jgi:2-polyprenyl-3-methyl-5-hydroxy-6-metoxy-1,4-benzoquinol methylase
MAPIPISEHYVERKPTSDAERYPIDIYQCVACSGVQTQDDIDPKFLWQDYTYYSGQTQAIVQHFNDVAEDGGRLVGGLAGKAVFDIGSNDGTLLASFRQLGARVWGVDPADSVIGVARAKGIKTYHGLFDERIVDAFDHEDRAADVITAFNVFAHSADMPGMCRGVANMLKDDGIFLFEIQYLGDISKRKILGTFFHEHMIHYSAIAAEHFLRSHGLKIFDYLKNDIQMGSVIFCAAHEKNAARTRSQRFADLVKQEKVLGFDSPMWATAFNAYIRKNRQLAEAFAAQATAAGHKVAAYGGARSGPSLLIQFGIDRIVDVIFDDHKDKVGKYSPFRGLHVLPTAKLSAHDHKYCVVTAYIHIKPILQSLEGYLTAGGRVIALWPQFTVISLDNRAQFLRELEEWMNDR